MAIQLKSDGTNKPVRLEQYEVIIGSIIPGLNL